MDLYRSENKLQSNMSLLFLQFIVSFRFKDSAEMKHKKQLINKDK